MFRYNFLKPLLLEAPTTSLLFWYPILTIYFLEDKTFDFVLTNKTLDRIDPGFVSIQWPIIPSSFPPEVDPQEVLAPPHPPVVWLPPRPALKPPSRAVSPLPASAGILATSYPGGPRGKPRHKPVGRPVIVKEATIV